MCLPCVCVCILRLVSLPLNTLVDTFILVNMWHVCVFVSTGLCIHSVYLTVCLHVFYDIFYCLFVRVCSCTLYSAVVLLVSIKFRFILGFSSVWYETQRQDSLSGLANKKQQTNSTLKFKNKPELTICPENYNFG